MKIKNSFLEWLFVPIVLGAMYLIYKYFGYLVAMLVIVSFSLLAETGAFNFKNRNDKDKKIKK